jgi:hypothetical protein
MTVGKSMYVYQRVMFVLVVVGFLSIAGYLGCKDSMRASISALGNDHLIQQYSGGKLINTWTSSGKPSNSEHSDGYYFKAKETGQLIEVSGDIVITTLD